MLIDWFTVIAQATNFLILVWLLRRFLFKPVLAAIDAREQTVAAELGAAAAKEKQAQAEREDYQHRNERLELQREALLRKATEEAQAERQRLIDAARQDADALRAKLAAAIASERAELNRHLIARTQQEVFAIARKVLAELAGTRLEDRMVDVFIHRLAEMPDARNALHGLPSQTHGASPVATAARIRSAFELPQAQRTAIATAVKHYLGMATTVEFEVVPDLISGVELTLDGRKLAWSISDFLISLARTVAGLLEPKSEVAPVGTDDSQHAI